MFDYERKAMIREFAGEELDNAVAAAISLLPYEEIQELWLSRVVPCLDMVEIQDTIDMLQSEQRHLIKRAQAQLNGMGN